MSLSGEQERGGLERGELERELVGPQLVGPQLEREPRGEADSEAVRELRSAGIDVWMARNGTFWSSECHRQLRLWSTTNNRNSRDTLRGDIARNIQQHWGHSIL